MAEELIKSGEFDEQSLHDLEKKLRIRINIVDNDYKAVPVFYSFFFMKTKV